MARHQSKKKKAEHTRKILDSDDVEAERSRKRKVKILDSDDDDDSTGDDSSALTEVVPKTSSTSSDSSSESSEDEGLYSTSAKKKTVVPPRTVEVPNVKTSNKENAEKEEDHHFSKGTNLGSAKVGPEKNKTYHDGGKNVTKPGPKGCVTNVFQAMFGKSAPEEVPSSVGSAKLYSQQQPQRLDDSFSSMSHSQPYATASRTVSAAGKENAIVSKKKSKQSHFSSMSHATGPSDSVASSTAMNKANDALSRQRRKFEHASQSSLFRTIIKTYCFPTQKFICSKRELEATGEQSIAQFMYVKMRSKVGIEDWWDEWGSDFNLEFNKIRENAISRLSRVYIGKLPTGLSAVQMDDSD
jgi:hypothetical protein